MAKPIPPVICFLSFILCFAACFGQVPDAWCTVRWNAATAEQLQQIIDDVCSKYDCSAIKPGGACFEPNRLDQHASYAMDLQFKKTKVCNLDVSQITTWNPSYGNCHYP